MSATAGSWFAPYVCTVYSCGCGRRAVVHGAQSGSPPPGWTSHEGGRHVCEACSSPQPRRAQQPRRAT